MDKCWGFYMWGRRGFPAHYSPGPMRTDTHVNGEGGARVAIGPLYLPRENLEGEGRARLGSEECPGSIMREPEGARRAAGTIASDPPPTLSVRCEGAALGVWASEARDITKSLREEYPRGVQNTRAVIEGARRGGGTPLAKVF